MRERRLRSSAPICCGIDITARRAIFVFLTLAEGQVVDITVPHTHLKVDHPDHPEALRRFHREAQALFDARQPDRIAIVERRKSGRFAAGGTTFKLESLLQLYEPIAVTLVAPALLRQFVKERQPALTPRFSYQKNAYLLARYLLVASDGILSAVVD